MKLKIVSSGLVLVGFAGLLWMNVSASAQHSAKSVPSGMVSPDSSIHWDKMDHAARKAYMKQVVFPAMKTEFAAFNPQKFGNMKCTTCHGKGAENDSYKMPNPEIFKLPRSKEGWAKADTAFMRFMRTTVKPKMADLLGIPPFDMKTMTGFGCGNCHADEE
ncbi:MAG: hypothetical protein ACHQM6_01845 [Candidatus Kapaibacterium sp.]